MLSKVPFQPECKQHIKLLLLSKINIGAQSAVNTPSAIELSLVNKPSDTVFVLKFFLFITFIKFE